MKITSSILSIPPYLSTTWKNISSLHVREENGALTLIVILQNRVQVEVPGLNKNEINIIFDAHAKAAEEETGNKALEGPFSFSLPLKAEGPITSMGNAMQHNPAQAHLPPLPPEVLDKITMIAKAFGLEDASTLPQAESNCNCIYCQVARSLNGEEKKEEFEEITPEDLSFRNWDIQQTGDHLYMVTNPLDTNEHYSVFLDTPLGCTCGSKNCEHIRAVLNS